MIPQQSTLIDEVIMVGLVQGIFAVLMAHYFGLLTPNDK